MNTDSYSDFFSEDKINIIVKRALALPDCTADSACRCHVSKILHEMFCPCLLSGCPSCNGNAAGVAASGVEDALVTEVTARVRARIREARSRI